MKNISNRINISASRVQRKKKIAKMARMTLLGLVVLLVVSYAIVGLIYNSGNFSITLDRNLYFQRNLIIYDDPEYKVFRTELRAETIESLDNVSHRWLPDNLHDHPGGSHNGENYIAYTFYIENIGDMISNYWTEIEIVDVISDVDEAVRIRVYKNDEYVTYAKMGSDGNPEPGTIPFMSDDLVALEHVQNFKPGDIDKYTVVIWLEGSDPECTDNILGGEIKIQMNFNSEFVEK